LRDPASRRQAPALRRGPVPISRVSIARINSRPQIVALAIGGCVVVALLAYALFSIANDTNAPENRIHATNTITIDDVSVRVEIVDTDSERAQGLSGKTGLAPDEGMLFVFEEDGQYGFWMHDMLFPIDIIWIASDGSVVHVEKSLSPDTYPRTFTPPLPARYVLEVAAGFATEHEIEVGSKLEFSL
jgi:uncharacterized protein